MKDDCEQAFADFAVAHGYDPQHRWQWSFDKLQQDVGIISNIDASVGGEGHDLNWTVRTKSLVAILRDERYKAQRAHMKEIVSSGRRTDTE